MTKRNYMWDNIKGFLIISVVTGHLLHSFDCPSVFFYKIAYWIYTFHMPAFLFISGFWAKTKHVLSEDGSRSHNTIQGTTKPEKIACLISYYLIFHFLYLIIDILFFNPEKGFSFGDSMLGLWYLLALVFYYLFLPLFERLTPATGIIITIILSLMTGLDNKSGDYFSISRTFVFAPYFFMGYYTSDSAIEKLRKTNMRYTIGIISALISISLWYFAEYLLSSDFLDKNQMINQLVFYGNCNYAKLGLTAAEGLTLRMISYVISSLMIISILSLASGKKSILSHTGKNSLQIYILHLLPVIIFVRLKSSGINLITIDNPWTGLILILAGILFSLLLSCKVFSYPFTLIRNLVHKLSYLENKHN